jgi:protein-tyrosine phosphatase
MTSGYVDLHSHFLPALDDGATDLEVSLRMVAAVTDLGFSQLTATPHQRAGMYLPSRPDIDRAFAEVTDAVGGKVALGLAAENFWDDVLHERLSGGGLPSYPGGRAFLFEVDPQLMPPHIEDRLFEQRVAGRLPVMAHPERYRAIQKDMSRAEAIGRTAAMLVDLGAVAGAYGWLQKRAARRLLEENLVHAVATDVHRPDDARAAAAGMAWIRKRLGPDTLDRLLGENPRRILAGDLP